MTLWFAAIMGLVQGLTEFLPISSTAHLRITPELLGQTDPGAAFTAVIQLGTLAAVLLYFARDLGAMVRGILSGALRALGRQSRPSLPTEPRGKDARLALYLVLGTVPVGIAGLALKHVIVGQARSLWVVASTLIGVGIVMWLVDRNPRQERGDDQLGLRDALLIGCAQACAVIPGVSRSGATMAMALALGLRRDAAARFSFLLSIPAIGAAGIFELPDAIHALGGGGLAPLLVASVVAGLSGYASIVWLLRYLKTRSLLALVLYRVVLGLLLFGLLLGGVVN
jgi:undecaprenyl-diphosphatase